MANRFIRVLPVDTLDQSNWSDKVTCRGCKLKNIKRSVDTYNIEWIATSMQAEPKSPKYWHPECFELWCKQSEEKNANDEFSIEEEWVLTQDYLDRVVCMPNINWEQIRKQWNRYLECKTKTYTAKGIRFALYYYYEIKHGDKEKADGRIGIIPYIYEESKKYWYEQENHRRGALDEIFRQIQERAGRPVVSFTKSGVKKKNRKKWSLSDIKGGDKIDN